MTLDSDGVAATNPAPDWNQDDVPVETIWDPEPGEHERLGAWTDPDKDPTSTHAQFDGDSGGLDPASRRALVLVLKNRFITARSHRTEFEALVRDAVLIQARLNDMYLALHIDHERQVAYKVQVQPETAGRFPTLLHSTTWPREEAILLVRVRALLRAGQAAGRTRVFVDRQDLMDHLAEITPPSDTDRVGVTRRTTRAIEALVSAGVLVGRKDASAFEIDTAVESLVSQSVLEQLLTWIRSEIGDATEAGGGPATTGIAVDPGDASGTEQTTERP